MHSTSSTVTSSSSAYRSLRGASWSSGPPFTRHDTFVHTDTTRSPHRLALEHRVEGARPEHQRGREVEQLGDLAHRLGRHPAVAVLREVQQREHRRLRVRVARDDLASRAGGRVGERHQRSTSPITGSTLEMIATASATSVPGTIASIDWRL